MRKLLLAALAAVVLAAPASAAKAPPHLLRPGDIGPKVGQLQWLLGGHRPYVFREVKPTFHQKPNRFFGVRTVAAVKAMKWRLGYPARLVEPVAGPYFLALLKGKATRPPGWVALAAKRVREAAAAKPKPLALRIKHYEISQLGVTEVPPGSNWGPVVAIYQADTGAYHAAWCVSFQQHSFRVGGYGHFANDTASVYYAVDYYARLSMLHAKPKIGALVFFVDYDRYGHRIPGTGHAGYVVYVTAHGFVSVEGNASNRVLERWHRLGDRGAVFAYLPRVA